MRNKFVMGLPLSVAIALLLGRRSAGRIVKTLCRATGKRTSLRRLQPCTCVVCRTAQLRIPLINVTVLKALDIEARVNDTAAVEVMRHAHLRSEERRVGPEC